MGIRQTLNLGSTVPEPRVLQPSTLRSFSKDSATGFQVSHMTPYKDAPLNCALNKFLTQTVFAKYFVATVNELLCYKA